MALEFDQEIITKFIHRLIHPKQQLNIFAGHNGISLIDPRVIGTARKQENFLRWVVWTGIDFTAFPCFHFVPSGLGPVGDHRPDGGRRPAGHHLRQGGDDACGLSVNVHYAPNGGNQLFRGVEPSIEDVDDAAPPVPDDPVAVD